MLGSEVRGVQAALQRRHKRRGRHRPPRAAVWWMHAPTPHPPHATLPTLPPPPLAVVAVQAMADLDWAPEFGLLDGLRDSYEKDFGRGTYRKEPDYTAGESQKEGRKVAGMRPWARWREPDGVQLGYSWYSWGTAGVQLGYSHTPRSPPQASQRESRPADWLGPCACVCKAPASPPTSVNAGLLFLEASPPVIPRHLPTRPSHPPPIVPRPPLLSPPLQTTWCWPS